MKLSDRLNELVRACFTGIWIESHEHDDALLEINQLCRQNSWRLATWDIDRGLRLAGEAVAEQEVADPLAAVRCMNAFAGDDNASIIVLTNFHRYLGSAEIVQALARQIVEGKASRTIFVVLAPVVDIPMELSKLFMVIRHEMPTRDEVREIIEGVATNPGELPEGDQLETVIDAAMGLTRLEVENAIALSLVRDGKVKPDAIWELKASMLKKSGLLQLYKGQENFSSLGGLANLKAFCKRSLLQSTRDNPLKRPRGVLLLGVPGTGKSAFAKALGKEAGRPTLTLDVGGLLGSLVGQTEANVRRALQIADAMAPCILFVDELEKGLSGSTASSSNDSGVSSRMLGTLLTWMNDHTSQVYVVATCNDISRLPPELTRAERFDAVAFLDLPGREQKDKIWHQYIQMFELDENQKLPADDAFTGAEVRSCCRLASLLDIPIREAAKNIVPIAVTAKESVEKLRSWASGRCLDAERSGLYNATTGKRTSRRSISRSTPSNN